MHNHYPPYSSGYRKSNNNKSINRVSGVKEGDTLYRRKTEVKKIHSEKLINDELRAKTEQIFEAIFRPIRQRHLSPNRQWHLGPTDIGVFFFQQFDT